MNDLSAAAAARANALAVFAEDVRYYLALRPRQLPSKYLYDALGSALFDAITALPWYGLTRAEMRLLTQHAGELFDGMHDVSTILELGPGNGEKLETLIRAGATRGRRIDVRLIDISAAALERAACRLEGIPAVEVVGCEGTYEAGLEQFRADRHGAGRTIALCLGSNIGNFDPPGAEAFLRNLHAALRPGDMLLLGVDLVKPERDFLLAYDDPLGVTSAFNRNLLVRINRELSADFDLDGYGHRADWNAAWSRIEMHLVSRGRQRVHITGAGVEFEIAEGATIWTESSYKYRPSDIVALVERNGFRARAQWTDGANPFALTAAETQ
jgi:dimethylhistidine N-methyltransferase